MWKFWKKKPVTNDFESWRASKLNTSCCKNELEREGECEHMRKAADKLRSHIWAIHQALSMSVAYTEEFNKTPVLIQSYRTLNDCGVTLEMGHMSYAAASRGGQLNFEIPRFDTPIVTEMVRYQDTFEDIFQKAVEANQYIELSDDPQKLTYGFTVFRGDGIRRYAIRMADYNAANETELKMMGVNVKAVEEHLEKYSVKPAPWTEPQE